MMIIILLCKKKSVGGDLARGAENALGERRVIDRAGQDDRADHRSRHAKRVFARVCASAICRVELGVDVPKEQASSLGEGAPHRLGLPRALRSERRDDAPLSGCSTCPMDK
jgi:hypothetical protein